MDDRERLRPLLEKLGQAISESMSDSAAIAQVIEMIREAGFEPFLVLEITVGFSKRKPSPPDPDPLVNEGGNVSPDAFNTQDDGFLKSLKIKLN
jgi:hypothetical protein